MSHKIKLYDITYEKGEELKNRGFNYSEVLIKKTTSNYLQKNPNVREFLEHINGIMLEYIESVKKIRVFYNYNVPSDYRKIP